jgi:hypothetical protein
MPCSGWQQASMPQRANDPIWVGSSLPDNHDFVNLGVSYRPEAVIRQTQKQHISALPNHFVYPLTHFRSTNNKVSFFISEFL